jgi:hypothetical protein
MPNFLVIGAGRSGSTSLYHYLAQHPQIFMSPVKEPKFFALEGHALDFRGPGDERIRVDTTTTLTAYRSLFDGVRGELAVGEASTLYLSHEAAADAIARHVPEMKLIAILRDPAERAHSAFQHLTRDGYEPLANFEDALCDEPRRMAEGWYYFGATTSDSTRDRSACTCTRISGASRSPSCRTSSRSSASTRGFVPMSRRATTSRAGRGTPGSSGCWPAATL